MFPLRDAHRPAKEPWLTRLLIVANIGVFLWQVANRAFGGAWAEARLGVIPACYTSPGSCGIDITHDSERLWQPLFASLFLHGDWLHLAFNMLFLAVFGAGVEDKLGKTRFACLYFGCGIAASLAHIATHPFSPVPVIGASGAIAGVLGAYFILLPRSWILTYLPPIFLFPVPAPLFLILWFIGQISGAFSAVLAYLPGVMGGDSNAPATQIAWMAHLGGFFAGAAAGWSIKPWWKKKKSAVGRRQ
jgi:membrane associated rhomboid family serine protease